MIVWNTFLFKKNICKLHSLATISVETLAEGMTSGGSETDSS
jgi:hypothetical protein